ALPGWTEEHVNVWMDKGWTAQQIIEHHTQPVAPQAPEGFGNDFVRTEPMVEAQTESVNLDSLDTEPVSEPEPVSEAQLKRLKKAELVELAELQGLDASGTKSDIIARLVG
ncbi:MAG: hypothetical protein CMA40_05185, partial [Euryarchaeota archaeon]|nr:hypothetical protein [Euryarchaeota archaeon]